MTDDILSPRLRAEIAARCNTPEGDIRRLADGGANRLWAIGDRFLLRAPLDPVDGPAILARESVVAAAARAAGIRTPAVIATGAGEAAGECWQLVERAPGVDLDRAILSRPRLDQVYAAVGAELAILHRVNIDDPGLRALVEIDDPGDPLPLIDELVAGAWLDAANGAWLRAWFSVLAPYRPAAAAIALIHGDIAPQNLIVDPETGDLSAIIDWGDAMLTDPAVDFAKIPPQFLPSAIIGYTGATDPGEPVVLAVAARVLWHQWHWTLGRLVNPGPNPGQRHWSAPPYSRLFALLRFSVSEMPPTWRVLVPPAPDNLANNRD